MVRFHQRTNDKPQIQLSQAMLHRHCRALMNVLLAARNSQRVQVAHVDGEDQIRQAHAQQMVPTTAVQPQQVSTQRDQSHPRVLLYNRNPHHQHLPTLATNAAGTGGQAPWNTSRPLAPHRPSLMPDFNELVLQFNPTPLATTPFILKSTLFLLQRPRIAEQILSKPHSLPMARNHHL
jgi:hypothetical protein